MKWKTTGRSHSRGHCSSLPMVLPTTATRRSGTCFGRCSHSDSGGRFRVASLAAHMELPAERCAHRTMSKEVLRFHLSSADDGDLLVRVKRPRGVKEELPVIKTVHRAKRQRMLRCSRRSRARFASTVNFLPTAPEGHYDNAVQFLAVSSVTLRQPSRLS